MTFAAINTVASSTLLCDETLKINKLLKESDSISSLRLAMKNSQLNYYESLIDTKIALLHKWQ